MISIGKYKIDVSFLGISLFLILTIINTSKFGASLSWVIIPCLIIVVGAFFNNLTIDKKALLIFPFYIAFFISTLFSHYVNVQRDLITFAFFCFIYVLAVSKDYTINQVRLLNLIYIGVSLIISLNILRNWLMHNYYIVWFKRASFAFNGVYKDPNYVMAYIVPAMFLCMCNIFFNTKHRKVYIVIEAIMITNFITTGSRGPVIAFLLALFMFFINKTNISFTKKMKIISCVILFVILGWNIMINILPSQSVNRFLNSTTDSRAELWKSAMLVFYDSPVLGGGLGASSIVSMNLSGNYSHNVYIDILANSGILGSVTFLFFFIVNCFRTNKKNCYFILSLISAFMVPLIFINGFNTATFYFPLIFISIYSKMCSSDDEFDVQKVFE